MSTGVPWTAISSSTMVCSCSASVSASGGERLGELRRRRSARPAPAPSTAPGRSGCRGCRCRRRVRLGRLVLVEEGAGGAVEGVGEDLGARVAGGLREVLEADREREELAQAVPAQVVLLDQLLDVLGRGAAGAGLEQAAAVHQRDDREHLGAGAQLQDREQVGQVVAQHVAGDRDGVLAAADALQRERGRLDRRHDLDLAGPRCRARAGTP